MADTLRSPVSAMTLLIFLTISMVVIFGTYLGVSNFALITQHYHDISLAEFHFDDGTLNSDIGGYTLVLGGDKNVQYVDGYINLGLELNNTTVRASIGTQTRTTATVWFLPEANTGYNYTILRLDYYNGNLRAFIQYVDNNTIRVKIIRYGSTVVNETIDVPTTEGWHLYAITIDYGTDEEIFYFDGNEVYRANVTVPSRTGVSVRAGDPDSGIGTIDELLVFPLNDPNVVAQVYDSVHYYLPEDLRNRIKAIIFIIIITLFLLVIKASFTSVKRTTRPLNIPPGHFYTIIILFLLYTIFTAMITISAELGVNLITFLNITGADGLIPQLVTMLWAGLLTFWGLILYIITSYT